MGLRNTGVALFLFVISAASSPADIINVPADYPTIQQALTAANGGDAVEISLGTYYEANLSDFSFVTVRSTDPTNWSVVRSTVIDAQGEGPVFDASTGYGGVIDGLTLTNGSNPRGGAINSAAAVGIRNCNFVSNRGVEGGALSLASWNSIVNCRFSYNSASQGGAIYCWPGSRNIFQGCWFDRNWAEHAGGVLWGSGTDVDCMDCVINNNTSTYGGAIYLAASDLLMIRSELVGNNADLGGVMYVDDFYGKDFDIIASRIAENTSSDTGGIFMVGGLNSHWQFENVLFASNISDFASAGYFTGGVPSFVQCTFAENQPYALHFSPESAAVLTNCILWGNEGENIWGDPTVTYSVVEDGWPGDGNIDGDPLFREYSGFEYILSPGSPCIDAGDPTIEDEISDWHPRWPARYPNDARSDMGAYGGPNNGGWVR